MQSTKMAAIQEALQVADSILVVTHIGPDGDALGSLTAVGQVLKQLDKAVTLMCDDDIPSRFRYLHLTDEIVRQPAPMQKFDLVLSVDCGDEYRMGEQFPPYLQNSNRSINIDHHVTNTLFADINLVDGQATSTTEILYEFFVTLGVKIDQDLAMSLLTGLVTDTLGFRTVGVTAQTMRIVSELMAAGADLSLITMKSLNLKPLSTLRLWRTGLNHMQLKGGLLWVVINKQERRDAGHIGDSSHGLVNLLADVHDVSMGAVLLEMNDGSVRVGFRCRPPYNVADVAVDLGGGGHALAAGCTLNMPLDEAESLVVSRCQAAIKTQTAAVS